MIVVTISAFCDFNLQKTAVSTVSQEDPLDFVGKTGKRIEANTENEQLIDLVREPRRWDEKCRNNWPKEKLEIWWFLLF